MKDSWCGAGKVCTLTLSVSVSQLWYHFISNSARDQHWRKAGGHVYLISPTGVILNLSQNKKNYRLKNTEKQNKTLKTRNSKPLNPQTPGIQETLTLCGGIYCGSGKALRTGHKLRWALFYRWNPVRPTRSCNLLFFKWGSAATTEEAFLYCFKEFIV